MSTEEAQGGWCPSHSYHMAWAVLERQSGGSHLSLRVSDFRGVLCLVLHFLEMVAQWCLCPGHPAISVLDGKGPCHMPEPRPLHSPGQFVAMRSPRLPDTVSPGVTIHTSGLSGVTFVTRTLGVHRPLEYNSMNNPIFCHFLSKLLCVFVSSPTFLFK